MQGIYFCCNFCLVLSMAFAIVDGKKHKQQANHKPWNNTSQKQIADRCAGCHTPAAFLHTLEYN